MNRLKLFHTASFVKGTNLRYANRYPKWYPFSLNSFELNWYNYLKDRGRLSAS